MAVLLISGCQNRNPENNQSKEDRVRCQNNIRSLSIAVKRYQDDHGNWPKSLEEALRDMGHGEEVFESLRCPGYKSKEANIKPVTPSEIYAYIDWSRWFATSNTPGEYPLVYDRQLNNHEGLGINVGLINGTRFWDSNAKWLEEFSKKHSEYGVLMPR